MTQEFPDSPRRTSARPGCSYRSSSDESGDTIPLGRGRTLRVVAIRDDDEEQPPILVVEDMAG